MKSLKALPVALGAGLAYFLGLSTNLAATVSLNPVADTTLHEFAPNNNFGDGTSFQAGGRRQGGRARGLIRFNIAGSVPAGATITSASLNLNVTATPSAGFNSIFDLNRVTASWGEGSGSDHGGSVAGANQATWNNRFGTSGSPWTAAGGDFVASASATRAITGNGSYTFSSTAATVADVQGWLDNAASNFGWLVRDESELTPASIRRFGSRDSGGSSPILTINYTLIPEPGSASLLLLGLAGIAWRCRRLKQMR